MSKHWKRFAAVVVSLTMAFQFCVNDFYAYAETTTPETAEQTPADQSQTPAEPTESTEPAPEAETDTTDPAQTPAEDTASEQESQDSDPAQGQTPVNEEEQPQEQEEAASTLKLEFKDEEGNTLKTVDPIALTGKTVGQPISLAEVSVDTNIEGYTLVDIKDKNDSTKDYNANSVEFTLTKNVTELQLVYRANPKEGETQPAEGNNTNTTEDSQQGEEDSEDDSEEADTKDEETEEPVEEEPKEEVDMPEMTLSAVASDGAIVTVMVPEGSLPEGSSVQVESVESDSVAQTVEAVLNEENQTLTDYKAYDITILDKDGNEIQPEKNVQVSITGAQVSGETKSIFHIDDSQAVEKVSETTVANTSMFSASGFSIYVVTGSEKNHGTGDGQSENNTFKLKKNESITVEEQNIPYGGSWAIEKGSEFIELSNKSSGSRRSNPSVKIAGRAEGTAIVKYSWHSITSRFYIEVSDEFEYEVTFHANGGQGNPVVRRTTLGAISLPTADDLGFTREGYTFVGWSTDAGDNSNAMTFGPGQSYPDDAKENTEDFLKEDTTLYAVWLENEGDESVFAEYFIRTDGEIPYEPDADIGGGGVGYLPGGCGSGMQGTIRHSVSITNDSELVSANLGEVPSNETILRAIDNYNRTHGTNVEYNPKTDVIEWYVIKKSGGHYHVDGVIKSKEKYWVRYDSNGGQSNVPRATQHYAEDNVQVDFTVTPIKPGYNFLGWDTNEEATDPIYKSGGTDSFTMPSNNVTLYAIWEEKNSVTITYKAIGEGTVENKDIHNESLNPETGTAQGATAKANTGYKFVGWFDNEKCEGNPIWTDEKFIPDKPKDGWVAEAYYARFVEDETQWFDVTYTVKGNGTLDGKAEYTHILTGTEWSEVAAPTPVPNTGYKFVGWYENGKKVEEFPETVTADHTYVANFEEDETQWFDVTYTVKGNGTLDGKAEYTHILTGTE
ncbi:InlB B-repeat-containing protein, partial [Faecalicoccus acidiformans]